MRVRIVAVILLIAALVPSLSALPTTECNDGSDNDGDGLVDGNDPGCTKPYYADNSEKYVYDQDASWIFSGDSAPDITGPSAFLGTGAGEPTRYSNDTGSGDKVTEYYVEGAGSAGTSQWGQGTVKSTDISISGAEVYSEQNGDRLLDTPNSGNCGDGVQQASEDRISCPEDAGLIQSEVLEELPKYERDLKYTEPSGSDSTDCTDACTSKKKLRASFSGDADHYIQGSYSVVKETNSSSFKTALNVDYYYTDTQQLPGQGGGTTEYTKGGDKEGNAPDYSGYSGATDPKDYCTSVSHYLDRGQPQNEKTDSKSVSTESYDTGTYCRVE